MRIYIILYLITSCVMLAQFPMDCVPSEISKAEADSIIDPMEIIRQNRMDTALDSPWINPDYLPDELYVDRKIDLYNPNFLPAESRQETGEDSLGRPEYRIYRRNGEAVLVEKIGFSDNSRAFMAYRPEKSRWWKCAE
ncbi:MAG: hypothetical protein ACP5G4_07455 [bacterium]